MALSNIFREPRREIVESVVGIGAFGAAIVADYFFGQWFVHLWWPDDNSWFAILFGMGVGVFAAMGLLLVAELTHEVGDVICNALQDRGIHLRPRERR